MAIDKLLKAEDSQSNEQHYSSVLAQIGEVNLPFLSLSQNVSIAIVGKDMEFTIYDDDDVAPFLEGLEERPQRKVPAHTPPDRHLVGRFSC